MKKVDGPWVGPFKVLSYFPASKCYRLDLIDSLNLKDIHPIFHTNLIKEAIFNKYTKHFERPEPEEGDRWEIDEVLEVRSEPRTKKEQYKVTWKGYPKHTASWVYPDEGNFEAIKDFWEDRENKKKTLSTRPRGPQSQQKAKTRTETLRMLETFAQKYKPGFKFDTQY